ncbi:MAG: hypothetical protein IKM34_00210 [Clostridia bacterium]|nr:hypothetical protein [Clostridia bacterium]
MKKIFALLAILLLSVMLLTACGDEQPLSSPQTTSTEDSFETTVPATVADSAETTAPAEEEKIRSIEDMTEIDGVLSVTQLDDFCTASESAYKVEFEIDGLKRYAEIALPNDYTEKTYPTVLYFPDIGYDVDYLINNFAKKDVIVIRLFSRGSKGNEGIKDFCGDDFADAEMLLAMCLRCRFLTDGGVFSAGAVAGTAFALKLAAAYPDVIAGCAVIDTICDYEAFTEEQGEQIKTLFLTLVGCSEEELPEELAKRSPKNFYQTIKAPVILFCYEETPMVSKSHSEMLKSLLDSNGNDTELHYLNPVSSDFNGTAFMKLIPWIKSISENQK